MKANPKKSLSRRTSGRLNMHRKSGLGGPQRRPLRTEQLEERAMLAADLPFFQNAWYAPDVDYNGRAEPMDALIVISELRSGGSRALTLPPANPLDSFPVNGVPVNGGLPATNQTASLAEGESNPTVFFDVNGDDFLSPLDALLVISHLRGEGQMDLVRFHLQTTDLNGEVIPAVGINDSFLLQVSVQDLRPQFFIGNPPEDARGVSAAYLDLLYNTTLVSTVQPFDIIFAPGWDDADFTSGTDNPLFGLGQGQIDEVGSVNLADGNFDSVGGEPVLVFSIPFQAGVTAGFAAFTSNEADNVPAHEVVLSNPGIAVPPDQIIFGSTTIEVVSGVRAIDDAFTVKRDSNPAANSANRLNVLRNDIVTTPGGQKTIESVSLGSDGGIVALNDNGTPADPSDDFIDYTPPQGFLGTETFTYVLSDGLGNTDSAEVRVLVEPILVSIDFEVTDLSGFPVSAVGVGGEFLLTATVQDLRDAFFINNVDARGLAAAYLDVLYNSMLVTPVPGTLIFGEGFPDQQNAGFGVPGIVDEVGAVNFGAQDPSGNPLPPLGGDPAELFTVRFTVNADVSPGVSTTIASDPADLLPAHETVLAEPGGLVVSANDTRFGSVTIDIVPPVTAITDRFTVVEDSQGNVFDVLRNDVVTTPGGQRLLNSISQNPANGTVTIDQRGTPTNRADDLILYTPNPNFFGTDTFRYILSDGLGTTHEGTVTVTVTEVNDPPIPDPNFNVETLQSEPLTISVAELLANAVAGPPNESDQTLVVTGVSSTSQGGATVSLANGVITYTPTLGFSGSDSFTYTIVDDGTTNGQPDPRTATGTVFVNVTPIPDIVAFIVEATHSNGTPLTNISVNSSFELRVYVEDLRPLGENRGVVAAYLDLLYTNPSLIATIPANNEFGFEIQFGPGFSELRSVNHTPGNFDELGATQEGFGEDPLGSGRHLLVRIPFTTGPNVGSIAFTSNPADNLGHDVVLAEPPQSVRDVEIFFGSTTINVVTLSANAPVAANNTYSVNEDATLNVSAVDGVLSNDSDPDGDPLTARQVVPPSGTVGRTQQGGILDLRANGSFTYTPPQDFFGTDSFNYVANDGGRDSNVALVTITVNPIPDAPQAHDDDYNTDVNPTLLSVSVADGLLANDLDVDFVPPSGFVPGVDLTVRQVVPVGGVLGQTQQGGTLVLNADGSFQYTPPVGFTGLDTFTYVANDGTFDSNSATVRISVGITPRIVAGSVYFDVNNNGVRDPMERPIGGVEITLNGTDFLGNVVAFSTTTRSDGTYSFGELSPGNYEVRQIQPAFTQDGRDSIGGVTIPNSGVAGHADNDRITLSLVSSAEAVDAVFGERGLVPEFINFGDYFSSYPNQGLTLAFDTSGNSLWYSRDQHGWNHLTSISATLTDTQLTITVRDANDVTQTVVIPVVDNPRVRVTSQIGQGTIIRLDGPSSLFSM